MSHHKEKDKVATPGTNIKNNNTKTTINNTKTINTTVNVTKNISSSIKTNTTPLYKVNKSNICNDFQSISTISSIIHGCEWLVGQLSKTCASTTRKLSTTSNSTSLLDLNSLLPLSLPSTSQQSIQSKGTYLYGYMYAYEKNPFVYLKIHLYKHIYIRILRYLFL